MSGYVKASRKRFDHPLFQSEPYCRGYAWDWLVANAVYKERQIDVKGKTVTLERGQICYSIRFLADKWGWSKGKTERFITRLKTETMIETTNETGQLIITICNYSKYQDNEQDSGTENETIDGTTTGQERDRSGTNKKKEKKDNKEKNISSLRSDIDTCNQAVEIWNAMAKANSLPCVQRLTDSRKRLLQARLKDVGGIEGWRLATEKVAASDFLTGRVGDGKWVADFDFFISQSKFTKLMECKYDNRTGNSNTSQFGQVGTHDSLIAGLASNADKYRREAQRGEYDGGDIIEASAARLDSK